MSRYTETVSIEKAKKVFGSDAADTFKKSFWRRCSRHIQEIGVVKVSHGYDAPCHAYFCDLEPDCQIGIYYGVIGLTRSMNKGEYYQAMVALGLERAADAVAMDLPY